MITVLCANAGIDKTYEVDGLQVGAFHHPKRFRTAPGGKGINVARVLKALGQDVVVTGFAGGAMAAYMAGYLRREGIATDFVNIGEESRLCINIIDTQRKTQTRVDEVGPLVTPSEIAQLERKWAQLLQRSEMAILSGSTPRGIPYDFYGRLILATRGAKVTTILDAHDELLRDGIQAAPSVIKPNLAELSILFNKALSVPEGVAEASRELIEMGIRVVICSLGADGAIVVTRGHGEWRAHAPKVEVVSAVGSGDAMVAGFAAASVDRLPLEDRIRWALAAGSASAATFGAGFSSRAEVEALVPEVLVQTLAEASAPTEITPTDGEPAT